MKVKVETLEGVSTTWKFASTLPSGQVIDVVWSFPDGGEADFARLMLSKDARRFLKEKVA